MLHRVIVYHDETNNISGQNFKGHVLFFIPITLSVKTETPLFGNTFNEYYPKKMLFDQLMQYRQEYACDGKLHFSEISGRTWNKYDYAYYQVIALAVDALRSKSTDIFDYPLHCKVAAIFYPKNNDRNIYGGNSRKEQMLRHDETLLRILLKGSCHYLYDESNSVEVIQIISDGEPNHRQMDEERVVWRLTYDELYGKSPLRNYVSFASDAAIIHLPSNHKKYLVNTEEYIHANFLQVSDLLLGSIMRACYKGFKPGKPPRLGEKCIKKDIIATPVKEMLEKKKRGTGFTQSGHYKSFTVTQVNFNKDGINFHELSTAQIKDNESCQMSFFTEDM
ncbi:MAG TPA: hypothetical protein PK595_05270 [Bacteroidota bacterium]|nr:hypothetical protein [Bacteroidota bacterium]